MDQPPGIGIPPIADMDVHQTTTSPELSAKSNTEAIQKALSEAAFEIPPAGVLSATKHSRFLATYVMLTLLRSSCAAGCSSHS
jgi:hypothetical protein